MSFTAVVHNSYLSFNGKNYFRAGSESVHIGAYGEKRTPILAPNYLEVQLDIAADKLLVNAVTTVAIDFNQSTEADLKLHLKSADTNATGTLAYNDLKSGKLKLLKLEMLLGELLVVNSLPTALAKLRSYGGDARVCNEMFVVLHAELADQYVLSGGASFRKDDVSLKMSAKNTRNTDVTLSSGTCFAYLLAEPHWGPGKDRIEKFTDDQHGFV
jgi:hypothetical protein